MMLNPIFSHWDEINLNKPSVWTGGKHTYSLIYAPSLVATRPRYLSLPVKSSNQVNLSWNYWPLKRLHEAGMCGFFSPRKTGLNEGDKFLSLKQTVWFTTITLAIIYLNYYPNRLVPIKSFYHLTLYLRLILGFRKTC